MATLKQQGKRSHTLLTYSEIAKEYNLTRTGAQRLMERKNFTPDWELKMGGQTLLFFSPARIRSFMRKEGRGA